MENYKNVNTNKEKIFTFCRYTKKFEPTLWPDLMAFSDRSAEEEFRLPGENENDGRVCKTISPSANLLRDSVSELPGERGMP